MIPLDEGFSTTTTKSHLLFSTTSSRQEDPEAARISERKHKPESPEFPKPKRSVPEKKIRCPRYAYWLLSSQEKYREVARKRCQSVSVAPLVCEGQEDDDRRHELIL
ncbi:hypothetical protein O6P43_029730 [Quillaja saponaria]|uniref:Uncharacterized protein n=1 Tax=Quillaja saponaria TaxID=32244 RepID=A0AAD7PBI2_QUISA|nr:hypothetical protein O6P43_029730 [Quillaja saponaria]